MVNVSDRDTTKYLVSQTKAPGPQAYDTSMLTDMSNHNITPNLHPFGASSPKLPKNKDITEPGPGSYDLNSPMG